ncbi:MAG: acetylornithine deacetylase [Flavobacteriales bacterium]|jgi:acetylornithine deacetylase
MKQERIFKERLEHLIACPSVSSTRADIDMGNLGVIEHLANVFEGLGFECEIMHLGDSGNKANLIATMGTGEGGLVLAGHSDTVPFDSNRWDTDPLSLVDADNRFYGLGSCDMKGFFPVIMAAVEALALDTRNLKEPLIVLATADEESSMNGARSLVERGGFGARYAIIGEPTSLSPIRMHKGIAMDRIRIQGLAGHSSNPTLGHSALESMNAVISELLDFRAEIQAKYNNPGFEIQTPTLNLGCIHGGDNPNRICGHCELEFDLRPLPGMKIDVLEAELDARLSRIAETFNTSLTLEKIFPDVPPYEEKADSEIVKLCEKLSGSNAQSVAFATEAPFLQQLGMQTIVLGPGSIDQAHQPNEYIAHEQINPAINIIKGAITSCCI